MLLSLYKSSFVRDDYCLFSDISFSLGEDECLFVRGSSGVGKSTLFRCVVGLEQFTSGSCSITNSLAYQPQTDALLPYMSVRNMHALYAKGVPLTERLDALLEAVGLTGSEDKKISELSGGMRRRLAFAFTLFSDRRLLLFDEPFVHIGNSLTHTLFERLAFEQRKRRFGALIISHDTLLEGDTVWLK